MLHWPVLGFLGRFLFSPLSFKFIKYPGVTSPRVSISKHALAPLSLSAYRHTYFATALIQTLINVHIFENRTRDGELVFMILSGRYFSFKKNQ